MGDDGRDIPAPDTRNPSDAHEVEQNGRVPNHNECPAPAVPDGMVIENDVVRAPAGDPVPTMCVSHLREERQIVQNGTPEKNALQEPATTTSTATAAPAAPAAATTTTTTATTAHAYCCYVLQSEARPRRTYVGTTNCRARRLRQHNGALCGGAKATRSARPWRMVYYVAPFANRVDALRFEWSMHHPRARRLARPHYGVAGRVHCAQQLLTSATWRDAGLALRRVDDDEAMEAP